LVSSRTRVVAFAACSNILGSVIPVEEVVKAVRERAAKEGAKKCEICVDCVAYAPHRKIDVQKWDVDYCCLSFYKVAFQSCFPGIQYSLSRSDLQVYGPHIAALYTRSESLNALTSLAHHFIKADTHPDKLQPGGPGYEIVYSTTAVVPYLLSLAPGKSLDASFEAVAIQEQKLLEVLLGFLTAPEQFNRGVRIVGDDKVGMSRVPTISFVVTGQRPIKSKDVVRVFDDIGGVSAIPVVSLVSLVVSDNINHNAVADWHQIRTFLCVYSHRYLISETRCGRRRRAHFTCALQHGEGS
jgi:selenocysteine lyase/cysteine desulfurase